MVGWPPNTGWLLNIGYTDFVLFWRKNFEEKWRYSAGINVCVVHMVCLMVTYLTYWSIYTKPYHNEIQSTSCHGKELWLPCFENLKKQVNEVFPVLIRACFLGKYKYYPMVMCFTFACSFNSSPLGLWCNYVLQYWRRHQTSCTWRHCYRCLFGILWKYHNCKVSWYKKSHIWANILYFNCQK